MDLIVKEFNVLNVTKHEWELIHKFRYIRDSELNPEDSILSNDIAEKQYKQDTKNEEAYKRHYFVYKDNIKSEIIGKIQYNYYKENSESYKENKHLCQVFIEFLPEHRRKGFGLRLLTTVVKFVEDLGKSTIIVVTHERSGKDFLKK
ncbi:MAG: GNAT family N-acetyltransferase, partial [Candidatus Hodarchaeales archaeon]